MSPLLVGLALSVGAPALKDPPPENPPLVGRWAATDLVVNGRPDPQSRGLEYEFTGAGAWVIYRDGRPLDGTRTDSADVKARPAALDLAEYAVTRAGIFKVEGDTLAVLFHMNGKGNRLTGFDGAGTGLMKVVMKRVKSGD